MQHLLFRKFRSGVTLVELLIGVAVLGVLLAVAIPSLTGLIERRRVIAAAGEIASFFTFAKSEANVVAFQMAIHMEPVENGKFSCMILVNTGSSDNCKCSAYPEAFCPGESQQVLRDFVLPRDKSVTFTGGGTFSKNKQYVVGFGRDNRYTGVQDLQVNVEGLKTGAKLRVEYNNAGRVRTCSPDSSIGGFPKCS